MVIAKFLGFGPNDLIQMTFSLSQDGLGKFLLACLDQKMLENDLFTMRDQLGVVGLIEYVHSASSQDPTVLEGTWASVCCPVELDGTSYSVMEKVIFSGNSANSVVRKYEALADSESQCGGEGLAVVQKTSGTFSISDEKFSLEGKDLIEVESTFTRALSPNTEVIGVTHSTRRYFHIQGDRMYVAHHQEDDELKIESGHYWIRQ